MSRRKGVDKWFKLRFGKKPSGGYFQEWVGRFQKGNPTRWMDLESRKTYKKGKKKGWFD